MENIYKKLYFRLFNAMTQALEELGRGNSNGAKRILEQAQIQAEELFINATTDDCIRCGRISFRKILPYR
jgi:hypothetical protein